MIKTVVSKYGCFFLCDLCPHYLKYTFQFDSCAIPINKEEAHPFLLVLHRF